MKSNEFKYWTCLLSGSREVYRSGDFWISKDVWQEVTQYFLLQVHVEYPPSTSGVLYKLPILLE